MTDEQWQHLHENFETADLLRAVDAVDELRGDLRDDEAGRPPELRTSLLLLHGLALDVVRGGWHSRAQEMFNLADDLSLQVSQMMIRLEQIQETLETSVDLAPEQVEARRKRMKRTEAPFPPAHRIPSEHQHGGGGFEVPESWSAAVEEMRRKGAPTLEEREARETEG